LIKIGVSIHSKSNAMKSIFHSRQLFFVSLFTAIIILLISGCKTGELKDEVAVLNEKQAFITAQRDSLLQIISQKIIQYDTVYAKYNNIIEENKTLIEKNKSLQSGYNKRGDQLKKVSAENVEMLNALSEKSAENDSLRKVIDVLQQKVTDTDNQKTEVEKSNAELAQSLQVKDQIIAADSIAEANKPIPVKESGFISINETGGGFGLGDVAVDYSRSLISINSIAGYRVNNHFIAGIGTGVNIYNGGTMIPLYLDFRYRFNEGKVTPFFVADGGVLIDTKSISSSGLFINPAFGITKKLNNKVLFHLSAGLWVQEAQQNIRNSFFNVKVGVSFLGK
jgi:hypothetical protein